LWHGGALSGGERGNEVGNGSWWELEEVKRRESSKDMRAGAHLIAGAMRWGTVAGGSLGRSRGGSQARI
jgi:hypothetical protein